MKKKKLNQIICTTVIMILVINTTTVFANEKKKENFGFENINYITNSNINLMSDIPADDEYEEEPLGEVIVKHVDIDTGAEIADRDVYSEVPYGEVKVFSKLDLSGYMLQDATEKIVYVNENTPRVVVVFQYKLNTPPVEEPEEDTDLENNQGGNNTEKPVDKPVEKPNSEGDKPIEKPVEKPNTQTEKPVEKPQDKPSVEIQTHYPNTVPNNNGNNVDDSKEDDDMDESIENHTEFGTVIINYVDINTGEIFKTLKKENLELNIEYSFSGTEVSGYTLYDKRENVVKLLKTNKVKTIEFRYIKNEPTIELDISRMELDLIANKPVTAYYQTGNILFNQKLIEKLAEDKRKSIKVGLNDRIINEEKLEELIVELGFNLVSKFNLSCDISYNNVENGVIITKKINEKYNDKTIFIYKLFGTKEVKFVSEEIVIDGGVSFNGELSTSDYFITDEKIDESKLIISKNKETSKESNTGIKVVLTVLGIGAVIAGTCGAVLIYKKRKNK